MPELPTKSNAELEMEINRVLIHFEKEYMGRGPLETRTYIMDDFVLVRLKGVLTPSEMKLAQDDDERGTYLLKQVRQQLLDRGRPFLEAQIQDILGVPVRSVHTDISTKTGERFIIFTLNGRPGTGNAAQPLADEARRQAHNGNRPKFNK